MFVADLYNRGSSVRFSAGEDLLRMIEIKDQDKVLDIGCGTAKVTVKILGKAPKAKILAIDIAPDMIRKAKQEFGDTSIRFKCKDFLSTSYIEKFDVIVSNSVFHWLFREEERAFSLIKCALKKGGRFGIQIPSDHFCPILYTETLDQVKRSDIFKKYFHNFSLPWRFPSDKQYRNIIEKIGFEFCTIYSKDYLTEFNSLDEVVDYIRAAGFQPYLSRLPQNLHEKFINAFKLQLAQELEIDPDRNSIKKITFTLNRLFAFGMKEIK
jgi:trans-aconitate methyltransferase